MSLNLNLNLKEADTSRPILTDGMVNVEIESVEVSESKKNPGNYNLCVKFFTIDEYQSTKGKTINPGFNLRKYFPLQQSDNPDAPDFRDDLARLFDAAFHITDPADRPVIESVDEFKSLIGQRLTLRIASEDAGEYGVQNVVKGMFPIRK